MLPARTTIGRSLKEFRRAQDDFTRALNFDVEDTPSYRNPPRSARGGMNEIEEVAEPAPPGDETAVPDEPPADAAGDDADGDADEDAGYAEPLTQPSAPASDAD